MARRTAELAPSERWLDTARGCVSNNAPGTLMVTLWLPGASSSQNTASSSAAGHGLLRVSSPPHLGRRRSFHRQFELEMLIAQGRGGRPEEVRYGPSLAHTPRGQPPAASRRKPTPAPVTRP